MDRKFKNDKDQETKTTNANRHGVKPKSKCQSDDCLQIDNIIGTYGKYQFMIFLFKILIGATSAPNNLGVTFYAPTDFVSFWCADSEPQSALGGALQPANHLNQSSTLLRYEPNITSFALDHPETRHDATTTDSFIGTNLTQQQPYAIAVDQRQYHSSSSNHLMSRGGSFWTVGQVLTDFIYNNERAQRRANVGFNSDTPKNLRKECSYVSPVDNKRHKCTSFKYDTGIWMSTIIDEWDLVCERSLFISISQSLYMAGFIASYLVFGYLSDRFGRWRSLLIGASIEIITGLGCAFSTSVTQFMVFRFLLGLGNAGRSSSSYLIMIEWTGQSWRMHISTLGSLGWVVSYCAMPWLALFFLHFRHMQLFVCFYELVLFIWLLRLPESPRWLLTHRRYDEAYKALLRAAKFNGLIKPSELGSNDNSTTGSNKSSSESIAHTKSARLPLRPAEVALRKLDPNHTILLPSATGSFARKRLNSVSLVATPTSTTNRDSDLQQSSVAHESIVMAPSHDVYTDVQLSDHQQVKGSSFCSVAELAETMPGEKLQPYTMEEFDQKFYQLAETISQKEFTKNEDRLTFVDLFRWQNLRKYTLILAFVWGCNSFIYYGIALRVGDFGGKNLFVSFFMAGATELPGILFTILLMKFLPRKTANLLIFSATCLICALQVPLKQMDNSGWLQQSTMMITKLLNACAFTCILYQTMELFPTSIRQTAYSSCSLASRVGSIIAPFIKELSQLTNSSVPPILYSILSLIEALLIRRLPETQGSDLPDTLLEAEKFRGTNKEERLTGGAESNGVSSSGLMQADNKRTKLSPA